MENGKICPECGSNDRKQGKLFGYAALHPLDSRVGIGGSDLIFTYCARCGEVLNIKVNNPEKIQ